MGQREQRSGQSRAGSPSSGRQRSSAFGFFVLILSLGYVAMQQVYAGERRLQSIENELAIARQLQFAILPTTTPHCDLNGRA